MLAAAGLDETVDPLGGFTTCPANGALPAEGEIVTVRDIQVHELIATQLEALLAAAEAGSLHLTGGGYRSHSEQIALRRTNCGTNDYAIYDVPASHCSPPTARPGTSQHELGLSIDFDVPGNETCTTRQTRCYQWLSTNAARYGLYNLPSEPWHWSTSGT